MEFVPAQKGPSPFDGRRRLSVAIGIGILTIATIGMPRATFALDTGRSLSQAFHRVWQVQQGLPQASIFAICQTSDGYLWLGSPAGLIRFDGIRFSKIRECAGVAAERLWILDLCEDLDGNLWIATDGAGLIRWRGNEPARFTAADGLPSDVVHCVLAGSSGDVWAGTAQGLVHIGDQIMTCKPEDDAAACDIRAMCQAADGKIWVGGRGSNLYVYDGREFTRHELSSLPAGESIRDLLASPDGTIWVATSAGLVRLKDGVDERLTSADGLASNSVQCLAAGKDQCLWIGTRDGFSRYYKGRLESFTASDGLSQSTVYALCEDREGSIWVGTKHGLNQLNDRRTVPYTMHEGLPSNAVGPVCQDSAGTIWVGTLGAGLARFDGHRFVAISAENGLASDTILSLTAGLENNVWVGTDHGLNLLHHGKVERAFGTADGLPSDVVQCLCLDQKGSLWAGTPLGAARLDGEKFVVPEGNADDLRHSVRAMAARRNGELVIATSDAGLFECIEGRVKPFKPSALRHRDVAALYEGPRGRLWLGTTDSGLFMLDGDRVFNFTMKAGLFDDDVVGLVDDPNDNLWLASSTGMSYVARNDLIRFAAGELKELTSTPLRITDAQRTYEAREGVQPCICAASDGTIWLSTKRAIVAVDSNNLTRPLPEVPVVVEQVLVNGRPRDPADELTLKPGMTNVQFDYTGLSFLAPTRLTFRYKLEGFDQNWVDAGSRREAIYTNLSPGKYRFRVIAQNIDGHDWEAASPILLTIEPHFYQTVWFLPSCFLLIGLVIWGAYRLRVRGIKDQMRVVVAERGRIARELHDTLMQGFSGVTMEMQALSARLEPSEERVVLDEIIRDAATCLREARRSVAGLRHAPGAGSSLAAALQQAARQLTETRDVRLKLNLQPCPQRLPVDVEYNLLRIAQEAISNAVKHAAARTISVTLEVVAPRLVLTIQDDGTGFTNSRPDAMAGHYGLIGMKERAAQIGAEFHIDSETGRGTTVQVRLPLSEASGDESPDQPAPRKIGADS